MRVWLAALLVAFTVTAHAAELTPGDRQAIRGVVEAQLEAFQRDDGQAAFGFASPTIQDLFRTPEGFMSMVRSGYPAVYRPQQVSFQDVITYRGQPTQRVFLVGPDGLAVIAYYLMEPQPDGSWRIAGCILEPIADAQA